MPPTVSVVLPTFNRAGTLGRAVRSVLTQTYADLELIVVDDASTDNTSEVLERFGDPRLRYLRHEANRGGAAARNTGIAAATGEFVAFQDSDDEWLADKLGMQVAALEKEPDSVGAVYCAMNRRDRGGNVLIPGLHVEQREGDLSRALLRENFIGTPALLVRRAYLQRIGAFWTELPRFQDWELVLRLAEICRFRFIDAPLVRVHGAPASISSDPQAAVFALERILERHRARFRRDTHALAGVYKAMGVNGCLAGSFKKARKNFVRSIAIRPFGLAAWSGLFLSIFGAKGIHAGQDFQNWLRLLGWAR